MAAVAPECLHFEVAAGAGVSYVETQFDAVTGVQRARRNSAGSKRRQRGSGVSCAHTAAENLRRSALNTGAADHNGAAGGIHPIVGQQRITGLEALRR